MMRKYISYEKSTGQIQLTPLMSEEDVAQTPEEYILFLNKEELNNWKKQYLNQSIDDISYEEIITHNSSSIKHLNHGGKRFGAGRPKGPKSQKEKDKISQSMKGNQNAIKNKGETI